MTLASDLAAPAARPLVPRRQAAPWFIVEGLLLVLLGAVAAVLPAVAGVAAALVFGWVLILSGVFGIVTLFGARAHTHLLWGGVSSAIAVVVGLLVAVFPLAGTIGLATLVAAYLIVDAVAMVGLALHQRQHRGWGWIWLLLAAIASVGLAVFVLLLSAKGDATLIGIIVAIDLIVGGIALVSLGIVARRS
ncbi:MAG TPA: DUF308 domain-containing protein [Caulobacteraceae bacterium]|jgi:uncharacterized membrane protein HdeD (DUF308 family)|nr:DUF308 domain-containing protein [Caulobacteraceae bacterium]